MSAAHRTLAAFGLAAVVLAAPLASAPSARAADHSIGIADGAFGPSALTVSVGDTVTWTNNDDRPHTVTAESGAFDSGNLDTGASFSFTFTEPGTYTYRCDYHSDMQATVVVEAAPAPAAQAAPSTAAPSTAAATEAAHSSGHAAGQPDTALPGTVTVAAWLTPLLIGLGLVAFAFGLFPVRAADAVPERRTTGWRR